MGTWVTAGNWVTVNTLGEGCVLDDSGCGATVGGLLRDDWTGEDLASFAGEFRTFIMASWMAALATSFRNRPLPFTTAGLSSSPGRSARATHGFGS